MADLASTSPAFGTADLSNCEREEIHLAASIQRTALEAGEPVGIDPARDELSFFPLIYWPVVPGAARPSPAARCASRSGPRRPRPTSTRWWPRCAGLRARGDDDGDAPVFAVGVFDCDNLKLVNDQYGHDKGDVYLKTACRLICRA